MTALKNDFEIEKDEWRQEFQAEKEQWEADLAAASCNDDNQALNMDDQVCFSMQTCSN